MKKNKSIRMGKDTEETLELVREDMDAESYDEVLKKLFCLYETEKSKNGIKNYQNEVETFDKHVKILLRLYLSSLEDNQTIGEMVRVDYEDEIRSKEVLILELQERISIEKEKQNEVKSITEKQNAKIKEISEKYASAEAEITYLKELITEKDRLNQVVTGTCEEQKRMLSEMQQAFEEAEAVKMKVTELGKENEQLSYKNSQLENDLMKVKKEAESMLAHTLERAHLDMEKAVLECEKEYRALLEQVQNEKQQMIEKYQRKVECLQAGLQIISDEQ